MLSAYGLSAFFGKAAWLKVLQDSFYRYLKLWKTQLANVKLKINDCECQFFRELYFAIDHATKSIYSDPIWHIVFQTLCLLPHRVQDLSRLLFIVRSITYSINYPGFDSSDKI